MIRYILYVCIVLFLTYIGYFISGKYRIRKEFYKNWLLFHRVFLSEIEYVRRPVPDVVSGFQAEGAFKKIIDEYQKKHLIEKDESILDKDENLFLRDYFSFLGKSDGATQSDFFRSVGKKLEENAVKAEKNALKYTDLYVKLGFLCGVAIVILLI